MIQGIIFDMDGVIIDSNNVHYEHLAQVLKEHFKVHIPRKEFAMLLGVSSRDFLKHYIREYELDTTYERLSELLWSDWEAQRSKIVLKEGIQETLEMFSGYKIALATGADRDAALYTVTNFDIARHFNFIIGGDEVPEAKPNPAIFLRAAEGLHLDPGQCVVIEDALMGIRAAKAAGIPVISIPDEITRYQDHSIADLHLTSIKELTPQTLKKLAS